mgnify:CR=1 FL=1
MMETYLSLYMVFVMSLRCGVTNLSPETLEQLDTLTLEVLADKIIAEHHEYIRETGPELVRLGGKLLAAHGDDSETIQTLVPLINALIDDLTPHLFKEEKILFPAIRGLATGEPTQSCFGHIGNPIRMMLHEHNEADEIVLAIQKVTHNFTAPKEACKTWQTCYQLLSEFCQDLINHIHVEDTILFPKSIALADQ